MKIISIVGTRPQFIKLCMIDRKFKELELEHIVINTGQHYDKNMSDDLFDILEIKDIKYNLIKKGTTNTQFLGNTMIEIEKILKDELPNKVIVYGDCDTTLAGAIVSNKLEIQLIHIESGMRSYNKKMPEEINRMIVDNLSDILLCSTQDSIENLKKENIINNVFFVGNIHLELLDHCKKKIIFNTLNEKYCLLTIHRKSNTNPIMLKKIFNLLKEINLNIKFLIHPRTKKIIEENNIPISKNILIIEPQNYIVMIKLICNSEYVLTDSGGLQYECFYLSKKCIILREETEWLEPIKYNNNILFDWDENINNFINSFLNKDILKFNFETNVSDNIIKYII